MGNIRTTLLTTNILLLALSAAGCSLQPSSQTQQSIEFVKIEWNDLLMQDEYHYLVLIYSESCAHCREVLDHLYKINNVVLPKLYAITITPAVPVFPNPELTIGQNDIENIWIYAVPTMIEIEDKTVVNNIYGIDDVLSLLYSFKI